MTGRRTRLFASLLAVALCIDLAGLDCRRLMPSSAAAVAQACACQDQDRSGNPAGADCLCCSTLDAALLLPVVSRPADATRLVAPRMARPADGDPGRLYRPPLS